MKSVPKKYGWCCWDERETCCQVWISVGFCWMEFGSGSCSLFWVAHKLKVVDVVLGLEAIRVWVLASEGEVVVDFFWRSHCCNVFTRRCLKLWVMPHISLLLPLVLVDVAVPVIRLFSNVAFRRVWVVDEVDYIVVVMMKVVFWFAIALLNLCFDKDLISWSWGEDNGLTWNW